MTYTWMTRAQEVTTPRTTMTLTQGPAQVRSITPTQIWLKDDIHTQRQDGINFHVSFSVFVLHELCHHIPPPLSLFSFSFSNLSFTAFYLCFSWFQLRFLHHTYCLGKVCEFYKSFFISSSILYSLWTSLQCSFFVRNNSFWVKWVAAHVVCNAEKEDANVRPINLSHCIL